MTASRGRQRVPPKLTFNEQLRLLGYALTFDAVPISSNAFYVLNCVVPAFRFIADYALNNKTHAANATPPLASSAL